MSGNKYRGYKLPTFMSRIIYQIIIQQTINHLLKSINDGFFKDILKIKRIKNS